MNTPLFFRKRRGDRARASRASRLGLIAGCVFALGAAVSFNSAANATGCNGECERWCFSQFVWCGGFFNEQCYPQYLECAQGCGCPVGE